MSQYKIGTVTVTNASATVTGSGTLWVANVAINDWFIVDSVVYVVSGITNDTTLTLTAPYGGTTLIGITYVLHRDFAANGSPLMSEGDIETATVFNSLVGALGASDYTNAQVDTAISTAIDATYSDAEIDVAIAGAGTPVYRGFAQLGVSGGGAYTLGAVEYFYLPWNMNVDQDLDFFTAQTAIDGGILVPSGITKMRVTFFVWGTGPSYAASTTASSSLFYISIRKNQSIGEIGFAASSDTQYPYWNNTNSNYNANVNAKRMTLISPFFDVADTDKIQCTFYGSAIGTTSGATVNRNDSDDLVNNNYQNWCQVEAY